MIENRCDRDEVTFEAVAECHWQPVRQTPPGVPLLISETTDIHHFTHQATTGLGMLGDGQGRGMQWHSGLMVEASTGVVAGMAAAKVFYRQRAPKQETRTQRLNRTRESSLWGDVVDAAGSPPTGSQWVHVFDRGGDNFEALCHLVTQQCDGVIRASQRKRKVRLDSGESVALDQAIQTASRVGSYPLSLRSRPGQSARVASLNVRTVRITLPAPAAKSRYVKACRIARISMNVVIVEDTKQPQMTLTNQEEACHGYQTVATHLQDANPVVKTGQIESHPLR